MFIKMLLRAEVMWAIAQLRRQLYQPMKSILSVVSDRKAGTPAQTEVKQ